VDLDTFACYLNQKPTGGNSICFLDNFFDSKQKVPKSTVSALDLVTFGTNVNKKVSIY
jgi:hypothetical protein